MRSIIWGIIFLVIVIIAIKLLWFYLKGLVILVILAALAFIGYKIYQFKKTGRNPF